MASNAQTLPDARPNPATGSILALDLGTSMGWALRLGTETHSGTVSFRPSRYDGGGMRYVRFRGWLDRLAVERALPAAVYFEEVRRHAATDAAHIYGGFLAGLTAWCEEHGLAYQGVPVGTVKRFATGKGNADKQAVPCATAASIPPMTMRLMPSPSCSGPSRRMEVWHE